MRISPDEFLFAKWPIELFGYNFNINLTMTVVATWVLMLLIIIGAKLAIIGFNSETKMKRWQNFVEVIIIFIRDQIEGIMQRKSDRFIPLIGTFFIFILVANWTSIIPIPLYSALEGGWEWYMPPTGSFSTTVAFTIIVMACIPVVGVSSKGLIKYIKGYFEPNVVMLPFNIIGEISSGVSLAIRLYGNIMSGTVIIAILLMLAPVFFPAVMQLFGLLTGTIQAFIFAILATVYISSGMGEATEKEMIDLEKEKELRV